MKNMIIILDFKGYWLEDNKEDLPAKRGVYLVYTCFYDMAIDKVLLKNLIYIGKAENVRSRIQLYEKNELFKRECSIGETICYSYADISDKDELDMAENALVFAEKPKLIIVIIRSSPSNTLLPFTTHVRSL